MGGLKCDNEILSFARLLVTSVNSTVGRMSASMLELVLEMSYT